MAFTEDQWEILVAIAIVAKHAVQYLKSIFSQNNKFVLLVITVVVLDL